MRNVRAIIMQLKTKIVRKTECQIGENTFHHFSLQLGEKYSTPNHVDTEFEISTQSK